ncbi:PfkB family carbohydrate kinase, partial [Vibrio parahaemolyticus]|uniref:PfkB family carbohydrate kinase n=1 Tax=Vibrio parahaemolyticus TaxID=670 RepID=UPI0021134121
DLVEKALARVIAYDFAALMVTRRENGMTLIRPGQEPFHLPTQAKEVYDVTGAGDTVISVIAASVSAGKSFDEACALANA